jgi:hypothetical protein
VQTGRALEASDQRVEGLRIAEELGVADDDSGVPLAAAVDERAERRRGEGERRAPRSATSVAARLKHQEGDEHGGDRGREPDPGDLPWMLVRVPINIAHDAPAASGDLALDVTQPLARAREPLAGGTPRRAELLPARIEQRFRVRDDPAQLLHDPLHARFHSWSSCRWRANRMIAALRRCRWAVVNRD